MAQHHKIVGEQRIQVERKALAGKAVKEFREQVRLHGELRGVRQKLDPLLGQAGFAEQESDIFLS